MYLDVSSHTRQGIQKRAEWNGYSPNLAARQLQRKSTNTVGLILPASDRCFVDPYFHLILSGIGNSLSRHGVDL